MRKWWKRVGIVTGGLLGLGTLGTPAAHAQFSPLPPGNGIFAADPQAPCPPEFPNPGKPGSEPVSPFSVKDEGMPNAFTELECPPGCNPYHLTLRTEYLSWWMPRINIPAPLLTTSSDPVVGPATGLLGAPTTGILLGQGAYNMGMTDGYRITMGIAPGFMPPVEVSGMFFNRNSTIYNTVSNGSEILVRPIQVTTATTLTGAPAQSGQLIAGPGFGGGFFNVRSTFNLWGTDVDMFTNLADNGTIKMDFLFGYKHADLNDSFDIRNSTPPGTSFNGITIPPGFGTLVQDDFAGHNQFNGGTIGLRTIIGSGRLSLWTDAKLSMGDSVQWTTIGGSTTLTGGGGALTLPGGLLALPSNSVVTTRNMFTVIPEVNIALSCQVTPNLRIFGGYNVFYWSNVVRASDQISTIIDPTQLPTAPAGTYIPGHVGTAPLPGLHSTSFFAHGVNLGLEIGF